MHRASQVGTASVRLLMQSVVMQNEIGRQCNFSIGSPIKKEENIFAILV